MTHFLRKISSNPQQLRKQLRHRRLHLSKTEQVTASAQITEKILTLVEFQQSQHLASYIATDGEINPAAILTEAEKHKKNCYLPVLSPTKNQHLEFYSYHSNDLLVNNRFQIREPDIKKQTQIETSHLDLVLLPLVAFDAKGHRLGRGMGYYDRTFNFLLTTIAQKPLLIGLAYEFQKVDSLVATDWDVPLDIIVTEKNVYHVD